MKAPFALLLLTLLVRPCAAEDTVRAAQEALRERKIYFGRIDGMRSGELRRAVEAFQETRGLEANGKLTRETLAALGIKPDGVEHLEDSERAQVYGFLEKYLELREAGRIDALLGCYADRVAFYSDGTVDRDFLRKAHALERERWPDARIVLLNRIASPDPADGNRWIVTFRYRATVGDAKSVAVPVTEDNRMVVERQGNEWKVVTLSLVESP